MSTTDENMVISETTTPHELKLTPLPAPAWFDSVGCYSGSKEDYDKLTSLEKAITFPPRKENSKPLRWDRLSPEESEEFHKVYQEKINFLRDNPNKPLPVALQQKHLMFMNKVNAYERKPREPKKKEAVLVQKRKSDVANKKSKTESDEETPNTITGHVKYTVPQGWGQPENILLCFANSKVLSVKVEKAREDEPIVEHY